MKIKANKTRNTKEFSNEDLDELEADIRKEIGENAGDEDDDLDDMTKKQLLKFAKDHDIDIPKPAGKDDDEIREIIQDALDNGGGGDELSELENELEGGSGIDEMDKDELLEYIEENELDIDNPEKKSAKKLKALIHELEDYNGGGDDLDEMDKDELLEYIEENDIDIPKSKAKKMTEKKLRAAIQELVNDEGGDPDEININPDEMDKDEILDFIEEQDIAEDLGFTMKKLKGFTLKKLRTLLEEKFDDDNSGGGDKKDDNDIDPDEMDKDEIVDFLTENKKLLGIGPKEIKKAENMNLKKIRAYLKTFGEDEGSNDNNDNGEDVSSMTKKELYKYIKDNDIDIPMKKARGMTVAVLQKAVAKASGGSGKSSSKGKKDDSAKSGYLSEKQVAAFAKKVASIVKNADMLSDYLDEAEEGVTRKGQYNKIAKKIKALSEAITEIDDAIE